MKIKILLFSIAKDLADFEEKIVTLEKNATVDTVMDYLIEYNPQFVDWKQVFRFAVNQEYTGLNHELQDGDEVAVIPPVSGG